MTFSKKNNVSGHFIYIKHGFIYIPTYSFFCKNHSKNTGYWLFDIINSGIQEIFTLKQIQIRIKAQKHGFSIRLIIFTFY
jgi:hypothetical protein